MNDLAMYIHESMTMEECLRWAKVMGISTECLDKMSLHASLNEALSKEDYERAAAIWNELKA